MFKEADNFLAESRDNDPEGYERLEEKYPTLSKRDYYRIQLGEPISRAKNRRKHELKDSDRPVPKQHRRKLSPEDYEDYRNNKDSYEREWIEDYYRAKELADQGM